LDKKYKETSECGRKYEYRVKQKRKAKKAEGQQSKEEELKPQH